MRAVCGFIAPAMARCEPVRHKVAPVGFANLEVAWPFCGRYCGSRYIIG